jgi:flagellar biosynthetic protein FliR/FlhB
VIFPSGTPAAFKAIFSIFISMILSPFIPMDVSISTFEELLYLGGCETITGLVLGFITNVCFNSLKTAGSLIDQQLGLSMLNIYDPNTSTNSTLIANMLYWMGIIIFFSMNGHHALVQGISNSFYLINIGEPILTTNIEYIIRVFVECFVIGFKISVPLILALIIAEITLGLISKSVPQLNVMIISLPLKLLLGLVFLFIALPFIATKIQSLFNNIPSILDGTMSLAPIGVLLATEGDKTEAPTPKKKRDARKKGNVAKSKEVSTSMAFLAMLLILYVFSDYINGQIRGYLIGSLSIDMTSNFDNSFLKVLVMRFMFSFMKVILPICMTILIFGVAGNLMQTGFLLTGEGIKPSLSKINPLKGFKNMFSLKSLGNLVKSILVIVILLIIGYSFIKNNFYGIVRSGDIYLPYLLDTIIWILRRLLGSIVIASIAISIIDYVYQRFIYMKELKMTKQEVKDEYKQVEGDPLIKGKIKQKQRQMAMRRMMQAVPTATVIVTNPTHISIALRYERGKDETPVVVAKGADLVALKIREIAKHHDIPIIENVPLARLMYKEVDIDKEIPEKMYKAVAEVLVAVYKIKNKYK